MEAVSACSSSRIGTLKQHLFCLLQSKTATRSRDLAQIHAQIVVNGFTQKNFILAKLISSLIECQNLDRAYQAFRQIDHPSTVVCNHVIRGFATSPTPERSLLTYTARMERSETAPPDGHTYSFLIASCSAGSSLTLVGEQLHGRVVSSGFYSDVYVQTNLINMYSSSAVGDGAVKAQQVFNEMPQRSVVTWNSMLAALLRFELFDAAAKMFDDMPERNVVSWTTMIATFARAGKCRQALAFFREMRRANIEADQVALVAVLAACAELGDVELGRWIHEYSYFQQRKQQKGRLVSLDNALMHMYASCGLIEDAYKIFCDMPRRSTVSWTTMVTGFAMHGQGSEALAIFKQMQKQAVEPDDITFIGVLCACRHAGWVDKGLHYFEMMTRVYHIKPRIEHYGCIVDLLSRAGELEEAYKLIRTMPLAPNNKIWGALLGGCRNHKNAELASHVGDLLYPDDHLVLLANVHAASDKWDDVMRAWERMGKMGVKKLAGRSYIQVNGVIHDFVAGDETHRLAGAIYEMVRDVMGQAESLGSYFEEMI